MEKLDKYSANFMENDIMGLNLIDEDSEWPSLISSVGFREAVKRRLKTMVQGTIIQGTLGSMQISKKRFLLSM